MKDTSPLYNSRLIKNYVEYTESHYPEVDIDSLLSYAGITTYELEDQGHWLTQYQVDRFNEILTKKTGNPHISREVGRYAAYSKASAAVKQYALGFMTLEAAYWVVKAIASRLTRGSTFNSRKLGPEKVEITSMPNPGVDEKPYQCDNRMGMIESIAKLFTNKFAKIEHPTCIHKGGDICRYIITWKKLSYLIWKMVRNYCLLVCGMASLALFFSLPIMHWVCLVLLCASLVLMLTFYCEYLEKKELTKAIEIQGDIARDQLDEINIRYNNALLFQEIGQAASTILDIQKLLESAIEAIEKRLDFDRGGVWLADSKKTRLIYHVGYGYDPKIEELLRNTDFHLDRPYSKGPAAQAFKEQRPFLVNDIIEIEKDLSKKTLEFVKQIGTQSFICIPLIYEREPLGVLMVDNLKSKRSLTQSDMSLLMGIASQIVVSIANAISFQKLQESEEKYRTLFEESRDPIFINTRGGEFIDVNQSMLDLFGYTKQEMIGMNITKIYPNYDDRIRVFKELDKGSVRDFETKFKRKDGIEMECLLTASVRRADDGSILGYQGIIRDITERKQAEKERKKLEAQLMQAQKMEAIGTIAGGVAHNFRNILTVISMNSQILHLKYNDEPTLEKIADVLDSYVDRGAKLVNGLMQFARKQTKMELQPLNLASVVRETYELINKSFDKMIYIRIAVAESLPIMGDYSGLTHALMNLCTNARDAMPAGGVLNIDAHREGNKALVLVSDTGNGMDKETREKCFDPFFTTKEVNKGTGLGLSTTYGIVKEHRGDIHVYSELGQGTTFKLSFPIDFAGEQGSQEPSAEISHGEGQKILIVDDETEMCRSMQELLESIGYRASSVNSGKAAIAKYQSWHPDAVLLDRNMPEMDGISCGEKIMDYNPNAKIVIISGYDEHGPIPLDDERKKFIKGYLTKPINMSELSTVLAKLFE